MRHIVWSAGALALFAQPLFAYTQQKWDAAAIKNVACSLSVDVSDNALGSSLRFIAPAPSQRGSAGVSMTLSVHIWNPKSKLHVPIGGYSVLLRSPALSAPLSLAEGRAFIHASESAEVIKLYSAIVRGERLELRVASSIEEKGFSIGRAGMNDARTSFEACIAETVPDLSLGSARM